LRKEKSMKGGKINGDIREPGVCGSEGYEMIMESGEKWGFL
jgi:hypothetical protein